MSDAAKRATMEAKYEASVALELERMPPDERRAAILKAFVRNRRVIHASKGAAQQRAHSGEIGTSSGSSVDGDGSSKFKDAYARKAAAEPSRLALNDITIKKALEISKLETKQAPFVRAARAERNLSRKEAEVLAKQQERQDSQVKPSALLRTLGLRAAKKAHLKAAKRAARGGVSQREQQ